MGRFIKRFLLFVGLISLVSWTCMASQVALAQGSHQHTSHATSDLWSGYVAFAGHPQKFTSVSAKWIEPAVTCPSADGSVAFWVGFSNQGTVEQAGSFIQCIAQGQPRYWSFWEMYPTEPIMGVFQVQPGDVLKSSVSFNGDSHKFEMSIRDLTSGQSSTRDAACGQGLVCSRTSVDWIGETISGDLPNWGSIRFSACRAALDTGQSGPIGSPDWSNIPIDMVYYPSEQQRAVVSDLRGTGAFFRDIWKSA